MSARFDEVAECIGSFPYGRLAQVGASEGVPRIARFGNPASDARDAVPRAGEGAAFCPGSGRLAGMAYDARSESHVWRIWCGIWTAVAAEIVSAYVRNNSVRPSELPDLLNVVRATLEKIATPVVAEPVPEAQQPKVPVRKSIMDDHLVCLEDGKHFRSLKRHLHSVHQLTPDAYRAKWRLPPDYPMVAPAYATTRSNLAKTMGLGRKGTADVAADEAAAEPAVGDHDATAPERGRRRAGE